MALSLRPRDFTLFAVSLTSQFSIRAGIENHELSREIETRDGLSTDFSTVLYVSQHCWKTDWPTDWLTDCSIDWMNNWILTILLADWLTGLFKGRFIIYVEGAMVPMAIIFLERGKFSPFIFINCQQHSQWKRNWNFASPPLVSQWKEVWRTTEEIPHWWPRSG